MSATRPLSRRLADGRGISDSGRITCEATRQRERVRIGIQDVRGDFQRQSENCHPEQPCQRVIALALGERMMVTADHPFHLDIYDNYR